MTDLCMAWIGMPGPMELCIIGIVAVVLFGNRVPQVCRSLGRSIVEWKRGVKEAQLDLQDIEHAVVEKELEIERMKKGEPSPEIERLRQTAVERN